MQVDITAILVALGGVVAAIGVLYKTRVTTYNDLTQSLIATVNDLKDEQKLLKAKVEELQNQVDLLKDYENKFQTALDYIRDICSWLDNKGLDATDKPFMPPSLKKHYGPFVMRNHKEKE